MKSPLTLIFLFLGTTSYGQNSRYGEFVEINDLSYYSGLDASHYHKLNLVIPKGKNNFPLLLWIGGGAWSYVDRNMEMDLARKFAREGVAVASVGHRLSPAVWKDSSLTTGIKHPEHIKDIARAFKWLYDNASKYGYSQTNIFVGGFSSGGHLTALLAMDDQYLKNVGCSWQQIRGIIPVAGTYDIPHYYEVLSEGNLKLADDHVKGVFGNTLEEFLDASPTSYIKRLKVPMLLISDKSTYKYTTFFEDKVRESGFKNFEVIHIQELGHGPLWKNLSFEEQSKYRDRIVAFINTHTIHN